MNAALSTRSRPTRSRRLRFRRARQLDCSLSSSSRSGFTLVELLLVLVIVGVIAAVAWPSVLRMQADHDLAQATEHVRAQLGNARTWAIQTGLAYQFRFESNGQRFCVVPFEAEPMPAAATNGKATVVHLRKFGGGVGKKFTFQAQTAAGLPSAQKVSDTAFEGLPNAGEMAGVGWSGPIVFNADGSAVDAVISLADARGQRIDVLIRGLTGAASVGPMHREGRR